MLPISIVLCWFVVVTHVFFRAAEGIVLVPYAVVFPLLLVAPRLLYSIIPGIRRRVTREWVLRMEQMGLVAVLLNMPGVLFFHVKYPEYQYDRFLHFGGAIAGIWWLGLVATLFQFSASRRRLLTVLSISMFISLFAWEGYQWIQDQLFGAHTFYDYAQPIIVDFWEDIGFGVLGMVVGLWIVHKKFPQLLLLRRS